MKTWRRADEWTELALCGGSDIHTMDNPSEDQQAEAAAVCAACLVRPECIQWAIREKACAVIVAGVYLPDPINKRQLRQTYSDLEGSLAWEREERGEV